ncbi:hypothetical protein AOLI_G00018270 [Acnodon oligacanthus]
MANYRRKLKQLGRPELAGNSSQHKRPAAVKKPQKAELNYLPPLPPGESKQTLERVRVELLIDFKIRDNQKVIDAGVDNCREVVIRGLTVYLSEYAEHLITHYQHTNGDLDSDDLKHHTLQILTKGGSADGSPLEAGIVLEGVQVTAGLKCVLNACVILIGLMYAVNLSYPKPLR